MDLKELINLFSVVQEESYEFLHERKTNNLQTLFRIEDRIDELQRDLEKLEKAKRLYQELDKLKLDTMEDVSDFILAYALSLAAKGEVDLAGEYVEVAADCGGVQARIDYAKSLIDGTYGHTCLSEGIDILRDLAKKDSAEACYLLYSLHEKYPFEISGQEAKDRYLQASKLGHPHATEPLPEDYDVRPYREILEQRYNAGDKCVARELSRFEELDMDFRVELFNAAIDNYDPMAEQELAEAFLDEGDKDSAYEYFVRSGEHGLPINFLRAAEVLHANPHFYELKEGEDIGKAQEEEAHLYQQAAKAKVPGALTKIAIALQHAKDHDKVGTRGIEMLKEAERLGDHFEAPHVLGLAYRDGINVPKDAATAIHYFLEAANHGNLLSMADLASLYEAGAPGVDPDPELAARYFFLAGIKRK